MDGLVFRDEIREFVQCDDERSIDASCEILKCPRKIVDIRGNVTERVGTLSRKTPRVVTRTTLITEIEYRSCLQILNCSRHQRGFPDSTSVIEDEKLSFLSRKM
jgi:hypothetical protein